MKKTLISFLAVLVLFSSAFSTNATTENNYLASPSEERILPDILYYGDVDFDGNITIKDATYIQKGLAGLIYLTGIQKYLSAPNANNISVKTATSIQKHIADIKQDFYWEKPVHIDYYDNTFSAKIPENTSYYDKTSIIVKLKSGYGHNYTLADFPEYEFNSIQKIAGVYDQTKNAEYVLYLTHPGHENVKAAIQALEYRTYIDLSAVEVNSITYIS